MILLSNCSRCKRLVNASISKAKIYCLIIRSISKVNFFFLYTHLQKVLPRVFFSRWEEKRTGLTGYNINKTNWNVNHFQNWFGLVFLAETCFNSFYRSSSLVLRYSIVLPLYKCNTTRIVGRNRTTTAQDTSLQ